MEHGSPATSLSAARGEQVPKFIPLIGTAIGTIKAAKFLIVGGGVVGLQAIATAKRLGGSITAVDIREDARKAADSIGAKVAGFEVPADLAIDDQGRTRALPEAWLEKERAVLAPLVAEAEIVILSGWCRARSPDPRHRSNGRRMNPAR